MWYIKPSIRWRYSITKNKSELILNTFYPEESLKIIEILQQLECILIKMNSITYSCTCLGYNQNTGKYHETYIWKVQDLSILRKRVMLNIKAYEYECENSEYAITSFAEIFDYFLNSYSRMTERLQILCKLFGIYITSNVRLTIKSQA